MKVIRSGATIVIPRRTNRRSQKVFTATIVFASGLKIKITESEGVMNPTITRPRGHNAFIGLMGQGDDDTSNDFKKLEMVRTYPSESIKILPKIRILVLMIQKYLMTLGKNGK